MLDGREKDASETAACGRVTIDLGALADNWRMLSRLAGPAATAAVVKADAYGIGLEPAARALAKAGCKTFFVALADEGVRLRACVSDAIVYILNGLPPGGAAAFSEGRLRPVLSSWPELEEWATWRSQGGPSGAAIHVDTGMNRLGLAMGDARRLAEDFDLMSAIAPDLLMSHLACADEPKHPKNRQQLAGFNEVRALFPDIPASLANSAGIFLGSDYHFDLVRPGISLYGGEAVLGQASATRTVATLEARVLQIREVAANERIGYGATESIGRPGRIAVLGVGYADGYHRRAGSSDVRPGARGYVNGRYAPLVGRVSMDLIAIDVTDIDGVRRGDWVELLGTNVPVDEVARHAETIGYELLTALGRRYLRTYVGP
jgi:alanine racemase